MKLSPEELAPCSFCRSTFFIFFSQEMRRGFGGIAGLGETRHAAARALPCGPCSVRLSTRCAAERIRTRAIVARGQPQVDGSMELFVSKTGCATC